MGNTISNHRLSKIKAKTDLKAPYRIQAEKNLTSIEIMGICSCMASSNILEEILRMATGQYLPTDALEPFLYTRKITVFSHATANI
jgi:hypothetical protein